MKKQIVLIAILCYAAFAQAQEIFAGTGTVPGPVWRYDAGRLFWPALGMGAQGRRRRAFVIQDGQAAIRF